MKKGFQIQFLKWLMEIKTWKAHRLNKILKTLQKRPESWIYQQGTFGCEFDVPVL